VRNSPSGWRRFVNAEMIFAGGRGTRFGMLTHPGIAIMPAALRAARSHGMPVRLPDRHRRRL